MPVPPPANSGSRRQPGPEPLRRKRVQTQAPSTPPWRRRALNYLLIFVIVVLVVDGLVGENGLLQQLRARESYQAQRLSLEALREENQQLRNDIRRLRDDPDTLESLAREELGLIRPGEVLVIIKDVRPASR